VLLRIRIRVQEKPINAIKNLKYAKKANLKDAGIRGDRLLAILSNAPSRRCNIY
jgi:hypothetical protein